jgi:hypothetical protein
MCERQLRAQPTFFAQAPLRGDAIGFTLSGVAATGVGPKKWPESLVVAALLQQHLTILVKQKD